jgi:hypothetical protein
MWQGVEGGHFGAPLLVFGLRSEVDCCHIGFLGIHMMVHAECYGGAVAQVKKVYSQDPGLSRVTSILQKTLVRTCNKHVLHF